MPTGALLVSIFFAAYSGVAENISPSEIVRRASANELRPESSRHPVRFRLAKVSRKGSTVKDVIETTDGDIALLLERDGKPLPPLEERAEIDRLTNLLAHPETQQSRSRKDQQDTDRKNELLRMLPEAFLYTSAGMVQGTGGTCYRLTFKPNPAFTPPDRDAQVFEGMEGELWIDQAQLRLVKMDAHLISDVNFGWGVIGRLYKGGTLSIENADIGDHHWETMQLKLHLKGKILMTKNVEFFTTEEATDFRVVPPQTGYLDAIQMLLKDTR